MDFSNIFVGRMKVVEDEDSRGIPKIHEGGQRKYFEVSGGPAHPGRTIVGLLLASASLTQPYLKRGGLTTRGWASVGCQGIMSRRVRG